MWSPKRQKDGKKHFSYEYMKRIQSGDVIFSYANAAIIAIGVAKSHCYSFPKPDEFGKAGASWSSEGWRIDVNYRKLSKALRTIDHVQTLREFLPNTKSPIRSNDGGANQAYLFQIEEPLAIALAHLIDEQTVRLVSANGVEELTSPLEEPNTIETHITNWEDEIETYISDAEELAATERESLVKARRGQGKFRELLLQRESLCRITGVDRPEHLIASHIKPWRSATNSERLDPDNGFMLTPSVDHLFDKGFISFDNDGEVLLADVADRETMKKMGIISCGFSKNIGVLASGQKKYLDWHREYLFLA